MKGILVVNNSVRL